MSLINDMLKDLDRRNYQPAGAHAAALHPPGLAGMHLRNPLAGRTPVLAGAALLVAIVLAGIAFSNTFRLQQTRTPDSDPANNDPDPGDTGTGACCQHGHGTATRRTRTERSRHDRDTGYRTARTESADAPGDACTGGSACQRAGRRGRRSFRGDTPPAVAGTAAGTRFPGCRSSREQGQRRRGGTPARGPAGTG